MRVVLATNVYVSAFLFGGPPAYVVTLSEEGAFRICISLPIIRELKGLDWEVWVGAERTGKDVGVAPGQRRDGVPPQEDGHFARSRRQPHSRIGNRCGSRCDCDWGRRPFGTSFSRRCTDPYAKTVSRRSYCQKWCLTIDSSGGLVGVGHFDSIVKFHSSNHLEQIIESS